MPQGFRGADTGEQDLCLPRKPLSATLPNCNPKRHNPRGRTMPRCPRLSCVSKHAGPERPHWLSGLMTPTCWARGRLHPPHNLVQKWVDVECLGVHPFAGAADAIIAPPLVRCSRLSDQRQPDKTQFLSRPAMLPNCYDRPRPCTFLDAISGPCAAAPPSSAGGAGVQTDCAELPGDWLPGPRPRPLIRASLKSSWALPIFSMLVGAIDKLHSAPVKGRLLVSSNMAFSCARARCQMP